jgi:hypothetical protein
MRFRQARRCAIDSPTLLGRKLILHSDQVTVSFGVNKIDHDAGLTTNSQIDRPAANAAIFDQRLLRLRGVDLQRKNFAAVRTGDFGFNDKLHVKKTWIVEAGVSPAIPMNAAGTAATTVF